MTADEINRRKAESSGDRDARKNEAIRQIKERRAKLAKTQNKVAPAKQQAKPAKGGKGPKRPAN